MMLEDRNQKPKESLSFIQQLQNQIQLCREALSNNSIPLTPRVEALECFLWAKLKDDIEYLNKQKEMEQWFNDKTKDLKDAMYGYEAEKLILCKRKKAKELFKQIIIFIDKKGYMPIGEE